MDKIQNVDYHICDICNLNCASCNHFCPLTTNNKFITIKQVKNDLELLKKFEPIINKFTIIGGEVLLHPQLNEILILCDTIFHGKLKLITNGTLIKKLENIKSSIDKLNIELVITEYPFKSDWKNHYNDIKQKFPKATFYTYRTDHGFISEHLSYQKCNTDNNVLLKCDKRYKCLQYINGNLYICHYAAFLPYLQTITTCEFTNTDSFINLRETDSASVINWMNSYIPDICQHCLYVKKPYELLNKKTWCKTNKNPNEWIK